MKMQGKICLHPTFVKGCTSRGQYGIGAYPRTNQKEIGRERGRERERERGRGRAKG